MPEPDRSPLRVAVGAVALVVALLAALVGFAPLYGSIDYFVAGLVGVLLGTVAALLPRVSARKRVVRLTTTALIVIVGYFLLGGVLAERSTTLGGVVPSITTLGDLASGVVTVWKAVLTTPLPLGVYSELSLAPFIIGAVCAACAVGLTALKHRWAWAVVPVLAALVTVIAFGANRAAWPIAQVGVLVAATGGWLWWRRSETQSTTQLHVLGDDGDTTRALKRRAGTAAMAMGAAVLVLSLTAAAALAPASPRKVLRNVVPTPVDVSNFTSPLVSFRKYVGQQRNTTLFTVTGLPTGARVRLATLDAYNGVVYSAAGDGSAEGGSFYRVGSAIPDTPAGKSFNATVTVGDLSGSWVPDSGYLSSMRFTKGVGNTLNANEALAYDTSTGTAITSTGLSKGATYTITGVQPESYSLQTLNPPKALTNKLSNAGVSPVPMPQLSGVPDSVGQNAAKVSGNAKNAFQQLEQLNAMLRNGYFSNGLSGQAPSLSGHSEGRIASFLSASQMIGDDEQYAVTMALMARNQGLPARVVMGFYPAKSSTPSKPIAITGADAHVWVEVDFNNVGWVTFDPTPLQSRTPIDAAPKQQPAPQSQIEQPPLPPKLPAALPPDSSSNSKNKKTPAAKPHPKVGAAVNPVFIRVGVISASTLLILLVIALGPGVVIAALKNRRRNGRRAAPTTAARLSGSWDELVDRARDLGTGSATGATRREQAVVLAEALDTQRIVAVADRTDGGVFGPRDPDETDVAELWLQVDAIIGASYAQAGFWARFKARISLRSFRQRREESRSARSARPTRSRDASTAAGSVSVTRRSVPASPVAAASAATKARRNVVRGR